MVIVGTGILGVVLIVVLGTTYKLLPKHKRTAFKSWVNNI